MSGVVLPGIVGARAVSAAALGGVAPLDSTALGAWFAVRRRARFDSTLFPLRRLP